MTPLQFVDKWRPVVLTERAAAQEHFIDLCRLFDHPTPVEDDPIGERFTFEKGVQRSGGGDGFADVWKRGFFGWEYKKRKRNLDEALGQLARYALALENPPLHIVCDTERFRIVTAYTNNAPKSYDVSLEELLDHQKRDWLAAAFHNPERLKPGASRADLTKQAADKFSSLTHRLQQKGYSAEEVGHFVNQLVFLFFAEDIELLDENFFRKAIASISRRPSDAKALLTDLFKTFQTGGRFGLDRLPWINGGLFDGREALPLDEHEIGLLKAASSQHWAHIDPIIFGTLFERFLDPEKRAQIGAHYTDAAKIKQIIGPVVEQPLQNEWSDTRAAISDLTQKAKQQGAKSKNWQRAEERRSQFLERLRTLTILDPACGSGNFLYLALQCVKNIEQTANQECEAMGLPPRLPMVGPEILRGIEINHLAVELARTTVWIGDIQWAVQNGIRSRPEPILRRLDVIERRDALLSYEPTNASLGAAGAPLPVAAAWPDAEFIVGNPPFLGNKRLIEGLGEDYIVDLRRAYPAKELGGVDFVMYWFYKAFHYMTAKDNVRVGFVGTNSIRDGSNRAILSLFSTNKFIFDAWSDEEWINEGASVRVSIACFASKYNSVMLNGSRVEAISSNLQPAGGNFYDLTKAKPLPENVPLSYFGLCLAGPFAISGDLAREMLKQPQNVNGRPNADVVRPIWRGYDVADRPADRWVIDFGPTMSEQEASYYEKPFSYLVDEVKPKRTLNREAARARNWWRHGRARPEMRKAIDGLKRFLVTPETAKHRFFVWMTPPTMPEHRLVVIARDDDFTFGVLSSRFHVAWALAQGGRLEDRPVYNTTRTFDTFPFPAEPSQVCRKEVEDAAKDLNRLRNAWLNPADIVHEVPECVAGFPNRVVAVNADAQKALSKRTMTGLYNQMPSWLSDQHSKLDEAVAAAYGWSATITLEEALGELLALNAERAASTPSTAEKPGHSAPQR